ncbi:MAG: hypothetical protein DKINENOH_05642 [bacterium]|nr:hypothetical protein [bacterium]
MPDIAAIPSPIEEEIATHLVCKILTIPVRQFQDDGISRRSPGYFLVAFRFGMTVCKNTSSAVSTKGTSHA